jgi:hypothetical protein
MSTSRRNRPVRANSDRSLDRRRTGSGNPEAVVHHVNLSCSLDMVQSESFSIRIGRSPVEVSTIEDAVRFIQEWTSAPKSRRSSIGKRMPVDAVRAAALTHPDSLMRRSCLFFLDHYDCDGSVETFRLALSDPASFVRESALHGIACERCRHEEICVSHVVGDLVRLLASDTNPEVRHKTVVALGRFLDRDVRAPEAVARAAQTDLDAAVRLVARDMTSSGQPHHRGRKAALRDERRARRTRA